MQWQDREPSYASTRPGSIAVLESDPGPSREAALEMWLREASEAGADIWRLRCAPEVGGLWAGLAELIESLIPEIQAGAPDLLVRHGYEISLILPRYRDQLDVSRPLTDTAAPEERTRNYPADRAYRSLHGIIELLSNWHGRSCARPWALACDDYDRANGLVQRFFRELRRRRGVSLGLRLLVAVGSGRGDEVAAGFKTEAVVAGYRPERGAGEWAGPEAIDPQVMGERAAALEAIVESDAISAEIDLPRLIHYWQHSTTPERALRWQVAAVTTFNHYGLYEASLEHADAIAANLDRIRAEDAYQYFLAVNGLFFCWVPLGQVERALRVTEDALELLDRVTLPRIYYLVAMLYARFLEPKDFTKADDYLNQALDLVAVVDLPEGERQFLIVFLMNGLALVRVRQRRAAEALALCQAGLDRLGEHLDPNQHRLHRSVLFYNIAQVYAQIGPYDLALEYFGHTMEMDPNYSEYYNDRGAVLFKMGRLGEAEQDFLAAIQLSPPYPEVWINVGQCYRIMERMDEAVAAYSRALDLDPASALAWAGRADAYASLDRLQEARKDYDEALRLDPAQALVWAGRAIVHYEDGSVSEARHDLDEAVALAPDLGELRQNRAVALQDLGLIAEAAADLRAYLELCPEAADRTDVEQQLESLLVAAAG